MSSNQMSESVAEESKVTRPTWRGRAEPAVELEFPVGG